ncbi:hypothetical protein OH76DRAFT_1490545 [Lentinus brumalis]|uniref:SUN domain-containing protein n=1 Tax=Lentinus brumalis TaxID=2498619 RepID=A0A371CIP9_9APHY|nr:hypothetical protein OH76DRAFT_1490545 [Polyporus brumalis]
MVLDEDMHSGSHWFIPDSQGQVGIKLPALIYPTHVTIDHIPREIAADIRQAPRQMVLWGLLDGAGNEQRRLAFLDKFRSSPLNLTGDAPPIAPNVTFLPLAAFESAARSVQEQHALPSDMERWADVLTVRQQCNIDMFTYGTPYAITRSCSMLLELYPGDADLATRLSREIDGAKQRSSELDGQWLQFKIMYDGYLLHLEKADREVMLKVYPELERSCEDVTTRAAALVSGNRRWARCFDLVLTEGGHQGFMETIDKRRAWTKEAFPAAIARLTEELHLLRQECARLSQETSAKWDSTFTEWFVRSGDRLPVAEFCAAILWYMDVVKQLTNSAERQKDLLGKFNGLMRFTKFNTTTLNLPGQAHVPVQDFRQAFEQFNQQWMQACRVTEMCLPLMDALKRHVTTLKATRDRI